MKVKLKATKNVSGTKVQSVEPISDTISKVGDPNFDTNVPKLEIKQCD